MFAIGGGVFLTYQGLKYGYFQGVTEYDDGVYYGSSLNLLHGLLPYHSYVDVQPPGIVLLLTPFALLGQLTSSVTGFEWARVFIVFVSVANVCLLGRLLHNRSIGALIAGLAILTFSQGTLVAEHTVLLEPVLVFGTLLALLLVFGDSERVGTSTHWLAAGVVLGLTVSVKLWGVLPFVVIAVLALREGRGPAIRLIGGAAAGFAVVFLPFFAAAPGSSIREVFIDQALRHRSPEQLIDRLAILVGANGTAHLPGAGWVLLWVLFAALVVGSIALARRRRPEEHVTQLDVCAMACFVLVFIALIASAQFYPHYAAFFAPFFALVVSAAVDRLLPFARRTVLCVAIIGAGVFAIYSAYELMPTASAPHPAATLDRLLPSGACILSVDNSDLLLANRYSESEPGCPRAVDWFGSEFNDAKGNAGDVADSTNTDVQNFWLGWLSESNGLILYGRASGVPDFGQEIKTYIAAHFRQVGVIPGVGTIYRRAPVGLHLDT